MNSFDFKIGTNIIFGNGSINKIGEQMVKYIGTKKTLILYGNHSKEKILPVVEKLLNKVSICYIKMGGIQPNPILTVAEEITNSNKKNGIEAILAIGGGSVIDVAKAVAIGIESEDSIWSYYEGKQKVERALPIGVILTNPASGSESSGSSVLTNRKVKIKRGCSSDLIIPQFAILDPELTYSIPKHITACALADIIMHTVERYLCDDGTNELSDQFSIALLKNVIKNGANCLESSEDKHARSEMMIDGTLSNNGFTGLGRKSEFPIHQIGHQISAYFETEHASSLTAIWESWAVFMFDRIYHRMAKLGDGVWSIRDSNEVEAARETIKIFTSFFHKIGLPITLTEAIGEISDEELKALSDSISNNHRRIIGNHWKLNGNDIDNILQLART